MPHPQPAESVIMSSSDSASDNPSAGEQRLDRLIGRCMCAFVLCNTDRAPAGDVDRLPVGSSLRAKLQAILVSIIEELKSLGVPVDGPVMLALQQDLQRVASVGSLQFSLKANPSSMFPSFLVHCLQADDKV